MALMARAQAQQGHDKIQAHPDFSSNWCRELLAHPTIVRWKDSSYPTIDAKTVSNSIFEQTLYNDRAIRAHLTFRRRCQEPTSIREHEECFLVSIGDALDGRSGRAHGGLACLLLDTVCGQASHYVDDARPLATATATITVDYVRPMTTPCVILVRAWPVEFTGRKAWFQAVIENESGVIARGRSLFIVDKTQSYRL